MKLLKVLIIFWMLTIITGCSEIKNIGQDKTNNIPETSVSGADSFTEDKNDVELNLITIQKDKHFVIQKYDNKEKNQNILGSNENYLYTINDINGNVITMNSSSTEVDIQYVNSEILSIHTHHGIPADLYIFYNIKKDCISKEYWNPLAINSNLIAYLEYANSEHNETVLVIRDIFDKTEFYQEIFKDFAYQLPDSVISAKFINNDELEITYIKKTDLFKTTEIINLIFP